MNAPLQRAEIARIAEQLDMLCGDDEALFHDMIIGESDIDMIVGKLHEQIERDGEMLVGISARQAVLAERKARLTARVAASKAAVGQFLRAAMLTKMELPDATYSVRLGKPTLFVIDPDAVPAEYTRTKVEPDKTAINAAYGEVAQLPNWLRRDEARDIVTARKS